MQISFRALGAKSLFLACALAASASAQADATITAIFGSGVGDNGWTAQTGSGVTLALRARERFPTPTNNVPSDGAGTYTFSDLGAYSKFGYTNLASWNFDFSINAGTANVSSYTYMLGIDLNASQGTTFFAFDPLAAFADNSFGTAGTTMGNGVEASGGTTKEALAAANSIAQNSENFGWLDANFNPTVNGTYKVYLAAFNQAGNQVARTDITVVVGAGGTLPEPASLALVGIAALGMAGAGRRRARRV